jgi:hypothetical protein
VPAESDNHLEIISRLLAMLVVKGMDKDEAILQLSGVGFSDGAVSGMLGVTESAVRGFRFRRAKKGGKKRRKNKAR